MSQSSDADHTPHTFDEAGNDTCRKCGNRQNHPVHLSRVAAQAMTTPHDGLKTCPHGNPLSVWCPYCNDATPASRDGAEGASTPWRWMKRGLTRTEVELQPAPSPPAHGAEPDCGYPAKVAELTAALDETRRQCQFWKELAKATKPAPDALREAWQWHGGVLEHGDPDWVAEATEPTATGLAMPTLTGGLTVRTARGNQRAHKRDWIVRIDGEIYLFSESAWTALSPAPVPPADGAKCNCGPMCQDLGAQSGCRYLRPERAALRTLVDMVWQHATESKAVPSTDTADKLIDCALAPSPAVAGEVVAKAVERLRQYASVMDGDAYADDNEPNLREDIELVCRIASASPPLRGEREAALRKLLMSAKLLQQNSEGCAANHYGGDCETFGLPGWLADTKKDIEAVDAILSLQSGAGEGETK